jgi:hypothetical protein
MVYSQGRSNKTNKIANDTSTKSEDDSVTSAALEKKKVFDVGLSFTRLCRLSRERKRGFAEESYNKRVRLKYKTKLHEMNK